MDFFFWKTNSQKLEKIQDRALRILYDDYTSTYDELLDKAGTNTLLINRLRLMALTVFKSINSLNPPCLNDIFSKKSVPYRMRDSYIIEQPKRRTTTFGLILFSYVGAKVWNELPTYLKETADLNDFKSLLNTWNGPDLVIQHSLICDILGFMSTTLYNLNIVLYWATHPNINSSINILLH